MTFTTELAVWADAVERLQKSGRHLMYRFWAIYRLL